MIALGSDHGGFALKEKIKAYLDSEDILYKDFGCESAERCDYPIYAKAAAEAVVKGECLRGILVCTSGIGTTVPICWPWGPGWWGRIWPNGSWRPSCAPSLREAVMPSVWN